MDTLSLKSRNLRADMDSTGILSLLEQLDDEIDDLNHSLVPILSAAISNTLSKLPLLDKAKLYILMTYAIESTIFSYLRLNGVNARDHPVFKELSRVKQYFDKAKIAEENISKRRNMSLDKQAASRFIRASLAGNDKFDLEQAEIQAKEKARSRFHMQLEKSTQNEKITEAPLVEGHPGSDKAISDPEGIISQPPTDARGLSEKRKIDTLSLREAEASSSKKLKQRKNRK